MDETRKAMETTAPYGIEKKRTTLQAMCQYLSKAYPKKDEYRGAVCTETFDEFKI
jgi:hypothetical protein